MSGRGRSFELLGLADPSPCKICETVSDLKGSSQFRRLGLDLHPTPLSSTVIFAGSSAPSLTPKIAFQSKYSFPRTNPALTPVNNLNTRETTSGVGLISSFAACSY